MFSRRVFSTNFSCSTSLHVHQAAERRFSAHKCTTSYSSSEHGHSSKARQHEQQESRKCMQMERRVLLLGVASMSAAMGLGAPSAQVGGSTSVHVVGNATNIFTRKRLLAKCMLIWNGRAGGYPCNR